MKRRGLKILPRLRLPSQPQSKWRPVSMTSMLLEWIAIGGIGAMIGFAGGLFGEIGRAHV